MIRVEVDPRWRDALNEIDGLGDSVTAAAKAASDQAKATSPILTGDYVAGHYHEPAESGSGGWVAEYGNTDTDANIVEYGWGPTPSYRTLTTAAETVGMRFSPR